MANPCARIEMAAPTLAEERESRRDRALKEHETDALLRACREPFEYRGKVLRRGKQVCYVGDKQPPAYLQPFVLVAARCGPRRGELLRTIVKDSSGSVHQYPGLRWEDIDWRSHRFYVRGKTGPRAIPMSRDVEVALREFRKLQLRRGHNEGHVFLDDSGTPVEDPSKAFSSAVRRAAIGRHVRIHDLRHTALTDLAKKGVPPSVIQKIAGHSSLQVTSLYANPDEDYVVEEFRRAYSS